MIYKAAAKYMHKDFVRKWMI